MPDRRQHRGPHPQDHEIFSASNVERLRRGTSDLSWLLSRGYGTPSAIKLVGDRYDLVARQRIAVARCACSDARRSRRQRHEFPPDRLAGQELWIDGFNLLTTIEASVSGGLILKARDGCFRDMASMHGSYKRVSESEQAIHLIGETLQGLQVKACRWLLDQPVSNSGRLKTQLRDMALNKGWLWEVDLVPDPDKLLKVCGNIVVSADSAILDQADRWLNLAGAVVNARVRDAWMMDLSCAGDDLSCAGDLD